ncbi:alpha-amylase [bacterium]|nr:alpha-amylase [bacterium]
MKIFSYTNLKAICFLLFCTAFSTQGSSYETNLQAVNQEIPLERDFRAETIYSLQVSRFFDGDLENNFFCRERIKKEDPHWRGDLKGLIEHLDYIQNLGFTAISINQPVENRGSLDFQGDSSYDWMKIDPRLESPGATFKDFIHAAHQRGFKVIQTFILNHSSNYGIRNQVFVDRLPHKFFRKTGLNVPWPYVFNLGNYKNPFREDNDNPRAPEWFQDYLRRDPWGQGPLIDSKTGVKLPLENYNPQRFFGTDEAILDREWYHRNGWLTPENCSNLTSAQGQHLGTDSIDLATENWKVKNYFNQALRVYLDLGIDAIRVDFAANIDRNELLTFVNQWREYKRNLFVLTDVPSIGSGFGQLGSDKYPSELTPWWYSRLGNDVKNPDSGGFSNLGVLDYPLFNIWPKSTSNGTFQGVGDVVSMDWVYGDPTHLVTFFHNFNLGPGLDNRYRFNGETWKAAISYNLMWTIRGIPSLLCGEEIEFMKGYPQVFTNELETLDMTGKAYFGDRISPENISASQNHPLYKHIQRLNLIRSKIPALQMGSLFQGKEWGQNGINAVVGLSAGIDETFTVERIRNGIYFDAITSGSQNISSGSITFSVKANSAGIWVKNGPGKIGEDGPFLK